MGTIKTTNIEPIADNGTVTLGSSGDTFTVPSGVTVNMSNATQTGVGGANTPAFSAKTSSSQAVGTGSFTKLNFGTEFYDTNSAYDTSNSRFTVPSGLSGKYHFDISVGSRDASTFDIIQLALYKNNSVIFKNLQTHTYNGGLSQYRTSTISVNVDLSASDYLEVFLYHDASGNLDINNFSSAFDNFFQGYKLIG